MNDISMGKPRKASFWQTSPEALVICLTLYHLNLSKRKFFLKKSDRRMMEVEA